MILHPPLDVYKGQAVEAVASTGGQLMPPVMGAAVFVMCDFTGIPYVQILRCAILPALLFYSAVFFMVHFEAVKLNLAGVPLSQLPEKSALIKGAYQLLPLVAIVIMLALGYSPTYALSLIHIWETEISLEEAADLAGFFSGQYRQVPAALSLENCSRFETAVKGFQAGFTLSLIHI